MIIVFVRQAELERSVIARSYIDRETVLFLIRETPKKCAFPFVSKYGSSNEQVV